MRPRLLWTPQRAARHLGARTRWLTLIVAASSLLHTGLAAAERPIADEPVLLVASPRLVDPQYRETVVVAAPIGEGHHVGIIINRPTTMSLASLFPDHAPSKQVTEPVFSGGPMGTNALLAVVVSPEPPGPGAAQIADSVFLTADAKLIDATIERAPDRSRYFIGYVMWRQGELAAELAQGMWRRAPMIAHVVLRKDAEGLWEDLWRRVNMIHADASRVMPVRVVR